MRFRFFLVTVGLAISAPPSAEAGFLTWCSSLFHRPTAMERFNRDFAKSAYGYLGDHREAVEKFLNEEISQDAARFSEPLRSYFQSDIESIFFNRYVLDAAGDSASFKITRIQEVLGLYRIILEGSSSAVRLEKILAWTNSEERARIMYERLIAGFYSSDQKMILSFLDKSPYFKDSVRMFDNPALLVTQSFEKETPSALISLYFRDPAYGEAEWFALSEPERMKILIAGSKKGETCGNFARTRFTPTFIDSLYREPDSHTGNNAVFEMKKWGFNLCPEFYAKEVFSIAEDLKEYHSIHSHVVFYAPAQNSQEFIRFKSWFLFLNDHYLLSGMEEGLHRSTKETLTNGSPIIASVASKLRGFGGMKTFSEVTETGTKWFNIGLRSKIYGRSIDPKMIKIGLEGRDFSRKKEVIFDFVKRVTRAASLRKWRGIPDNFALPRVEILSSEKSSAQFSERAGLTPEMVKRFEKVYPEFTVPMNPFETFPIVKVSDDGIIETGIVSEARQRTIIAARETYYSELRQLAVDIRENERKSGKAEDTDAIEMTLKWILTDWAKSARASEIFRNY